MNDEIFQMFGGMEDSASTYRTVSQGRVQTSDDQMSDVRNIGDASWTDGSYNAYHGPAMQRHNQILMDAEHLDQRAGAVTQCSAEGQNTLGVCTGIASSLGGA